MEAQVRQVLRQLVTALLFWTTSSVALADGPTLDDVLVSVDRHLPLLVAAQARLELAEGERLGAAGVWDPSATVSGWYKQGNYDQGYAATRLAQATPLYGLEFGVGWRVGLGKFAVYDGWYDTLDAGELVVDARLPLLKGGLTDARRTDLQVAQAGVDGASAYLEVERVKAAAKAREVWWKWVAAGEKVRIAERMLDVAHTTDGAVGARIARGDQRPIDALDAQRVVVERTGKLLQARRDLEVAAYDLGLFLRLADGSPAPPLGVVPDPLPTDATASLPAIDLALSDALRRRPDVAVTAAKQRAAQAKLRLARLDVLPKLDLKLELAQDLAGADEDPEPLDLKVGGELAFTLLQRPSRGKLAAANASLAAIEAELGWLRDNVAAEVSSAWTTVQAAHARGLLADTRLDLSQQLEDAVRTAYALGDTDLFAVYLREQSTLDAALARVEAWATYHVALARLTAATGAR